MYKYEDIRRVHIELTEKCQAACPMCARNFSGSKKLNPHLANREITLEQYQHLIPPEFVKQLQYIMFCGNFGDPIFANDLIEIIDYNYSHNLSIFQTIHTNGGVRTIQWWKDLAKTLNSKRSYVVFAIDGLEDTNHIYRRGVKWENVWNNLIAFVGAGGIARWDFLVFKHNQHQVDQAKQLADNLGIQFIAKKTNRFLQKNYSGTVNSWPVEDGSGDTIEQPTIQKYINKSKIEVLEAGADISDWDNSQITCIAQQKKEIYISAAGYVLPCCWIGNEVYRKTQNQQARYPGSIWDHIVDLDTVDGLKYGVKSIVNNSFIADFDKQWTKCSLQQGKPLTCSQVCGKMQKSYQEMYQ